MWCVINKRELLSSVYQSEDINLAIHEYLAIIRDEARTLVNAGVKPGETPHLLLVKVSVTDSFHSIIEDEAVLDLNSWTIKSIYGCFNCTITHIVVLSELKRLYSQVIKKPDVKIHEHKTHEHKTPEVKKPEVKKPEFITESKLCDFDANVTLLQTQLAQSSNLPDNLLPTDLEKQMMELERKKTEKLKELDQLKQQHISDEERATNYAMQLSNQRRQEWMAKDLEEQNYNKFTGGCSTYYALKQAINEEKMTEDTIPILFADQWPIYKWMDDNGDLEADNAYEIYKQLVEELVEPKEEPEGEGIFGEYVPHDINYPKKDVKPLNELLAEISSDDELPEFNCDELA